MTDANAPGLNPEVTHEQQVVDTLYARLDELNDETQRALDAAQRSQDASTRQNRSERDAFVARYEDRLSQIATASQNAVFGRLDRDNADTLYIGRMGVFNRDRVQLLVDWRAPAAAPFYQATSSDRQGVKRRRHLFLRNRKVAGIEDDVLDKSLLQTDSELSLQGEGALLQALSAKRTGRMGDIVSTIQAEQDRIIRADTKGVLVVQGGPGTGKTAVALHRAAYLLFTHRQQLEHKGVLIVAPNQGFLRYIERVLPSLGETGVVMSTLGSLLPNLDIRRHAKDDVALIKGDLRMSEVLRRAVAQRQLELPAEQVVSSEFHGYKVVLKPRDVSRARKEARNTGKPHNQAREVFLRVMLDALVEQRLEAIRAAGHETVMDDRQAAIEDLRENPQVRKALNLLWLPYTPQMFLRIFLAHPERIAEAAPYLSNEDVARLARPKSAPLEIEDLPLLDELAEILGEPEQNLHQGQVEARQNYAKDVLDLFGVGSMVGADELDAHMYTGGRRRTLAEQAAADRNWTYGHIVVDEAQELSPMQWRMLFRRCPSKSFTVVGDLAQTSFLAGAKDWQKTFAPFVSSPAEVQELTVNYRTPGRIMASAFNMADAAGIKVSRATSVREGEWPIEIEEVADYRQAAVTSALNQLEAIGGRVAIICPEPLVEAIRNHSELALYSKHAGSGAIDDEIAVLDPKEAKGLEFDAVTLVDPAGIFNAHELGAGDLFVAMSRPTTALRILHQGDLPPGL